MIDQGKAFIRSREKFKNKYEGFHQREIDTPVYDSSQQVYGNTQITNDQSNSELLQSQNDVLSNYNTTYNKVTGKSQDYVNRISSSNPYLNKFLHFTNDPIVYVTNLGVAKPITSWETYQSLLGKNGCPTTLIAVPMEWSSSYIEGSIIPLNPTLVVGPPMTPGETCGLEGKNVYVSSLISKDATVAYQGCYQDASPSTMTFIGEAAPVHIDASIQNGDFSQPVIPNNTYQYITSNSTIPHWDFNAVLVNNSDAWGFTKPYPNGSQCISIQGTQWVTQTLQFSAGDYVLSFDSVGRNCCDGSGIANTIIVYIDWKTDYPGVLHTLSLPGTKEWSHTTSNRFTIYTPGNHSISFVGTETSVDRSTAIQGIKINSGDASAGTGTYTYDQCKSAAIDGGYQYFGLQYGNPATGKGYCAVTNDSVGATKNGTSYAISGGIPLWASNTSGTGNTASLTIQGSLSVINSSGAAIFSTTPSSGDSTTAPSNYLGCYGDTGNRALPNLLGNNGSITLDSCKQAAAAKGYSYFGLQDFINPSYLECWAGSDLQQAKKYGLATNCTKLSDGTMVGGPWSNTVYTTGNPPTDYFLTLQDDGNICIYKGTGPTDNQGGIWCAYTQGQQQKPNPSYQASKGKYGKNYIKTGSTLATGDFVGSNDGSIYLLMQSDGNLVLYTSGSAENCSKTTDGTSSMGGQGATALYKMSEVGNPANLGKIGYVDKNSEIYMYPENKIGLSNNYVKHSDSDSMGHDIPGAMYSGGSFDECKQKCNGLSECYGFLYNPSVKACYPKDKTMYPVGEKQPLPSYDLYVREKMVKEGFETVEIDTSKWKNYANNNKIFDNSIVDSASKQLSPADKKELSDLNNKITSFSQEIQRNNAEYKQNLSSVNSRTVENTSDLTNYYDEYDKIKLKIKHSGTNLSNMNNIVSDTKILVLQQNAYYVFYATLAIILLIIAIKFLS